jgi:hypothetical protein
MFAKIVAYYKHVYGSLLPHALVIGEDCLYTSTPKGSGAWLLS